MIPLKLKCPYCNESLMDDAVPIANHPSVKLAINHYGKKGMIHLCSIYGNHERVSTLNIPDGEVVRINCPNCEANLASNVQCIKCGAPMAHIRPMAGGTIHFCTRAGCTKSKVAFDDLESELEAFYQAYGMG